MPNGDSSKKILAHKMWQSYIWKPIDAWDIKFWHRPFVSDRNSTSFTADELSDNFIKNMSKVISTYRGDHIFL